MLSNPSTLYRTYAGQTAACKNAKTSPQKPTLRSIKNINAPKYAIKSTNPTELSTLTLSFLAIKTPLYSYYTLIKQAYGVLLYASRIDLVLYGHE